RFSQPKTIDKPVVPLPGKHIQRAQRRSRAPLLLRRAQVHTDRAAHVGNLFPVLPHWARVREQAGLNTSTYPAPAALRAQVFFQVGERIDAGGPRIESVDVLDDFLGAVRLAL